MDPFNVTESSDTSSEVEELETLAVAIYTLRWVSVVTASGGIAGNAFTYLTASRLGTVSSGTTFIKCMAPVDCLAALANGLIPSGTALLNQKLLTLNKYTCKAGRFLTWTSVLWGTFLIIIIQEHLRQCLNTFGILAANYVENILVYCCWTVVHTN